MDLAVDIGVLVERAVVALHAPAVRVLPQVVINVFTYELFDGVELFGGDFKRVEILNTQLAQLVQVGALFVYGEH
jgi:hypothetical protein